MNTCPQCGSKVKNAENFRRHISACEGRGTCQARRPGLRTCKYCQKQFHSRGNYRRHVGHCEKVAGIDLQAEYDSGLSVTQICKKYDIGRKFVDNILTNKRSRRIATQLRKKEDPDLFFFGGTRRRSKGELVFKQMLEGSRLIGKYKIEEQYHLFRYRLDFAFTDIKLDVEIDGLQHYTNKKVIDKDKIREQVLLSNGWSVYRIASKDFLARPKVVFKLFQDFLGENHQTKVSRYNGQITDGDKKWAEEREQKILTSGIDFRMIGWTNKLGALLQISPATALRWVQNNMPKFYKEKCRTPRIDYRNRQGCS